MNKYIAVLGGGVMGGTLAQAVMKADTGYQVLVCDRDSEKLQKLADLLVGIKTTADPALCASADVVFLAVKPQDFSSITINCKKEALLCSIMAGISIASLRRLGAEKIVRMMPNTPAQVGAGFTVWTGTDNIGSDEKIFIEKILSCMGKHSFVEREDDMNKATAISGSGPAYFFAMLLAFVAAARHLGFSKKEASMMVIQTMKGASALIDEKSDLDQLVQRVTSKGGTTEAALKVFQEYKATEMWQKAVETAYQRAKELSKQQ